MKRMRSSLLPIAVFCTLLTSCGGGGDDGSAGGGTGTAASSVNGIVTDIGTGARLAGVTIAAGATTATTNAQGEFTISTTASPNLSFSKTGYAPGYTTAKVMATADAVLMRLKKQPAAQAYNAATTATLSQSTEAGPYAVILQPNSLDTTDTNIHISITPIDPTKEEAALPGSLVAGGTSQSLLLPVTFAEFTLLDSTGKRVNLKSSASAVVELPIPPSLRATYPVGSKIHCYSYDATTGKWEDFVDGTVQVSSVDGVTPVLAASIRHFSWYGGAPEGNNCADVYVNVVSAVDGKPLPNARVEASPGTVSYTDNNGDALVIAAIGNGSSTFTAYQTGIDVSGALTGIAGAKYIEFGKVEEELVGLVPKSCTGITAAKTSLSGGNGRLNAGISGTQGTPISIKVGAVKNLLYQAFAVLSAGTGSSNGSVAVQLEEGVPDVDGSLLNPLAASGAKVYLTEGSGTPVLLPELSAGTGFYAPTTGLSVTAGKAYTLSIDADGDGSIDGSGTISAIGALSWVNPVNGATVAATNLSASWADTGLTTAGPGYAPVYQVGIQQTNAPSGTIPDTAYYFGTNRNFVVKSQLSNAKLKAGTYTGTLIGFTGWSLGGTGFVTVPNNITGSNVTGQFFSLSTTASINFTLQ